MISNCKTAVLISCSDHYGHRLHTIDTCLKEKGYNTIYITSDFDHTDKKKFKCNVEGTVQLSALPYKKNLSFSRILSHRNFARDAFKYIEKSALDPDVIITLLPPNFNAYYAAKYKTKHQNTKLIFDVFDMWPETMPNKKIKSVLKPVFSLWSAIRDKNLGSADFVFCECEMFKELLNLSDEKSHTVYLSANPVSPMGQAPILSENRIELCYLGAINNVIGIKEICELIREISEFKPVKLHIIGKGERKDEFINSAKTAGAQVEFHGTLYDDGKKAEIIRRCHFGLNITNPDVCIGLTMKSIDYFKYGLPIINNIPSDTARLVESEEIGLNLSNSTASEIKKMSADGMLALRKNTERVFESTFSEDVIKKQYSEILDRIVK